MNRISRIIPVQLVTLVVLLMSLVTTDSATAECRRDMPGGVQVLTSPTLNVATLNIAHGRKLAFNQALVPSETIRRNLDDIALLFREAEVQIVALQEADAPSKWSGGFDHVEYLADAAGFPCFVHGHHVQAMFGTYGTALLSSTRFLRTQAHTFAPTPPTTNKGFVKGVVAWNPDGKRDDPIKVTVVSVHLDFLSTDARESQVNEIAQVLAAVRGPMVILGDFNAKWRPQRSAVRLLADRLELEAFDPDNDSIITYRDSDSRLDWILIANGITFESFAVLPDELSDHHAVVATLVLDDER
jgi:endonuclease/exonuclease/phosphatase family metal-dependent hydrolase